MNPLRALPRRLPDLRLIAVLLSTLLTALTILGDPLLNDDAFGYLRAAERFQDEGARAVLDNYGWYGYSILIALLEPLLPGGLLSSAWLLNAALHGLLVWIFISLVLEYRPGEDIKLAAALTILLFPLVNEMRHILIRDFGYWAFCLLALLQLVRYHKYGRHRHAVGWCLAMLAAIFFRLEGLVLLVLAPLSLLCTPPLDRTGRLAAWLRLQAVLLGGLCLVFLAALLAGIDLLELMQYAYRYYLPRLYNLWEILLATADQLNAVLFAPQNFPGNSSHGVVILLGGYAYTVLVNLFLAMSLPYGLFLSYSWWRGRLRCPPQAWLPAVFVVGGSLLALLLFMVIMHFLTQRYAALAALVLISFVPLALVSLYQELANRGQLLRYRIVAAVFIVWFSGDALFSFGYSKSHIEDAIAWTRNELGPGDTLHTNEYPVAYFSGRIEDYDRIHKDPRDYLSRLQPGDTLVAVLKARETEAQAALASTPGLQELTRFANEREDLALVYRYQPVK